MNFTNIKAITIPEGKVSRILSGDSVLWSAGLLPSAYQQVEYVQADNNVGAYIDLGFAFDTAATVYLTQYLWDSTAAYPFGATNAGGEIRCCISCPYSGAAAHTYGYNGSTYISVSVDIELAIFNEIKAVWKNGYLHSTNLSTSVEGKTLTSQTAYTMTEPLYLFAQNYKGSPRFGGMRRISKFQYFDKDDTLICDMIPCYRKSDGVIGMYDAVRKQFFTNVGTGSFTKGTDIMPLPTAYQQVRYIETDGNQYIDTGVNASDYADGIGYEWTGSVDDMASNTSRYIFGCLNSNKRSGNLCYFTDSSGNAQNVDFIVGGSSWSKRQGYTDLFTRSNITFRCFATSKNNSNATATYNDGYAFASTNGTFSACDMPSANIYLMACNGITGDTRRHQGKIIRFKMTDATDNLIRDYIPCYRKNDGVIGLYDTVGGQFYTNAGTGSFTKGADV